MVVSEAASSSDESDAKLQRLGSAPAAPSFRGSPAPSAGRGASGGGLTSRRSPLAYALGSALLLAVALLGLCLWQAR